MTHEGAVAHEVLQRDRACRRSSSSTPGFQMAESRMAPMIAGDQRQVDEAGEPQRRRRGGRGLFFAAGKPEIQREENRQHQAGGDARSRRRVACVVQKKSTPRRKPTNSGGSPSGDSAPPILATRKMKNITTWALCLRAALARISGRTRIMAAPVVPTMLAIAVPSSENAGIHQRACRARSPVIENAAGHHIEREQQNDEAHIFGERGVHEGGERARCAEGDGERRPASSSAHSGGDLAVMRRARISEQQRAGGDLQENAGERQRPGPAHRRAVERGGRGRRRGARIAAKVRS